MLLPSASWFERSRVTMPVVGMLLLAGCGGGEPHRADRSAAKLPAVPVRTIKVQAATTPAVEEVVGTVRARLRATIEAKASGRIVEMPVVLGQTVRAGELLVRLDAPETQARVRQAEASLSQADRDWKRMAALHEQQAASQSDYDTAQSRLELSKAMLAEARALLDLIEIKAPFNGVVTRKAADVGDLAVPGKPLVELEDPAGLQLEADVPEAIAGGIRTGAKMAVRAGGEAGAKALPGTVSELAPNADPASRTFRVKLDLPADMGIRSGQFARLSVPIGETTSLRVPAGALVHRGQLEIVFAVEDQHARMHLVKTGRQFGNDIEILSGLNPGDAVVVEDAHQLMDGQPVTAR